MNLYLTAINDYLVNEFYEDQFQDMRVFTYFISKNFSTDTRFEPSQINSQILPKKYKLLDDQTINVYQNAYNKIWLNAKRYYHKEEKKLINAFILYQNSSIGFCTNVKIENSNSNFFSSLGEYGFNNRFDKDNYFYVMEEPNWKTFKTFYMDFLKKTLNRFFNPLKESKNLIEFSNDYLSLVNYAFNELTPINKKIKINVKGLKNIKAKNKTTIKALIKWKKFLAKIKAETNIRDVEYRYFFEKDKLKIDQFDYVIKTYNKNSDIDESIIFEIINVKTSKRDFISPKEELAKMPSTEMHSLSLQDLYGIKLNYA